MSDVRSQIGKALEGFLTPEQVRKLVDEVLASKKRARAEFNCRKCGKRQVQYAEVDDTKTVVQALETLANQAFGKPTESKSEAGITFIRQVVAPDGAG